MLSIRAGNMKEEERLAFQANVAESPLLPNPHLHSLNQTCALLLALMLGEFQSRQKTNLVFASRFLASFSTPVA